jgi:hypothetical protein
MKAKLNILSTNENRKFVLKISEYAISFHYVAHHESFLMYQILLSPERKRNKVIVNLLNSTKDIAISNPNDLMRFWPSTKAELGGYGRPLQNLDEAKKLYYMLFCHIIVLE